MGSRTFPFGLNLGSRLSLVMLDRYRSVGDAQRRARGGSTAVGSAEPASDQPKSSSMMSFSSTPRSMSIFLHAAIMSGGPHR